MLREIPRLLRRADHFITPSRYTAAELAEWLGVPRQQISVVPLGVSLKFAPRPLDQLSANLSRYGLTPGSYTLCVGTVEPRKNLLNLLRAYEALAMAVRNRIPLVICGDRGWKSDAIHASINKAEREGWAKYVGYAPEGALPFLYAGACVFVYPSLYEGFGLPVLEAMASGAPVVAANNTSVPEFATDCALLIDPNDALQLRDAIERALDDDAWRATAAAAGVRASAEFTWAACASKTADVYRRVLTPTLEK